MQRSMNSQSFDFMFFKITRVKLYTIDITVSILEMPKAGKDKMKATLQKNVKAHALRLISDKGETDVKEYQFIESQRSPYDPLGGPRSGSSIENITPPPQTGQNANYFRLATQASGSSYGSQNSSGSSSSNHAQRSYQSSETGYGSQYSADYKPIIPVPPDLNQTTFMQLDKPSDYQLLTQYSTPCNTEPENSRFIAGQNPSQAQSNFGLVKDENYPEIPGYNYSYVPVAGNPDSLVPFGNLSMNNVQNMHNLQSNSNQSMYRHFQPPQTVPVHHIPNESSAGSNIVWTTSDVYPSQEKMEPSCPFYGNQMVPDGNTQPSTLAVANTFENSRLIEMSRVTQSHIPELEFKATSGQTELKFSDLLQIGSPSFTQKLEGIKDDELGHLLSPENFDFNCEPQLSQYNSDYASTSSGSTRSNPRPQKSARLDNISNSTTTVCNDLVPPESKPDFKFRATMKKFVSFFRTPNEAGYELNDEDIFLLKNYEKKRKHKAWPPNMADMMIEIYARLKPDEKMRLWKPEPVDEASSPGGFRLVRKNLDLNYDDEHRFGPRSLDDRELALVDLDLKRAVTNDNVNKCLETFERSGMVFIWRPYEEPEKLSSVVQSSEVREMLCRKLFCYRICKGYPSRNVEERERHDKQYRLKMLDMCIRPAGVSEGVELEIHAEFLQVFDILKQTLEALKIQRNLTSEDEEVQAKLKKEKSRLKVYLGLQSTKRYDSADLPMRIEISNDFIEGLVTEKSSHGAIETDWHSRGTRSVSRKSELN
ncbi:uncharacterized protein LOC142344839 isoform X3 [Convolutriloba macropyga]|uniref:uncharacterized protein LOC142344839 isoform X3 n=1 Tax=Convolutriloba macropyga TaxID=536237 RepID=UPI003F52245D